MHFSCSRYLRFFIFFRVSRHPRYSRFPSSPRQQNHKRCKPFFHLFTFSPFHLSLIFSPFHFFSLSPPPPFITFSPFHLSLIFSPFHLFTHSSFQFSHFFHYLCIVFIMRHAYQVPLRHCCKGVLWELKARQFIIRDRINNEENHFIICLMRTGCGMRRRRRTDTHTTKTANQRRENGRGES